MTEDEWDRLQAKRERNARFAGLEKAAEESQRKTTRKSLEVEREERRREREQQKKRLAAQNAAEKTERRRLANAERSRLRAERLAAIAEQKERARLGRALVEAEKERLRREVAAKREAEREKVRAAKAKARAEAQELGVCMICGRQMRKTGQLKADFPDTISHAGHGVCTSCAHTGRAPLRGGGLVHDGSTSCAHCSITLRPNQWTPEMAPGTRAVSKKIGDESWLCSTCYHRALVGPRVRKRFTHCIRCEVQLYRTGDLAPEGARRYAGRGLCSTCHSRGRRKDARPPCTACGVPLIPQRRNGEPVPDGMRVLGGRGMCERCYTRSKREGSARMSAAGQAA